MKYSIIVLLIAIPIIIWMLFSAACNKNCPDYLFYRIPYSLNPLRDTFNVNDTLWLEIKFNEIMTDDVGQIMNSFSNIDFHINAGCERIDIDPPLAYTSAYIDINTLIGSDSLNNLPISGVSYYRINPIYMSGNYSYKCWILLKEKGLFSFGLGSSASTDEKPFQFKGNCDNVPVEFGSRLENDSENNYHMLQWASNPAYHKIEAKRFSDYGGYCFVVK
ncbi:MAG: hypothetical protein KDC70_03645 [Saprospiraceae bacterium]|nr:hypothetical protein [Saprospiraceae bacterium]